MAAPEPKGVRATLGTLQLQSLLNRMAAEGRATVSEEARQTAKCIQLESQRRMVAVAAELLLSLDSAPLPFDHADLWDDRIPGIFKEQLESIVSKKWPASMLSDKDAAGGTKRTLRSLGLSFLGVPELVLDFEARDCDAAMGIFRDLIITAMQGPEKATHEKLVPGRNVLAARCMMSYAIHDAVDKCKCLACELGLNDAPVERNVAPLWHVMESMLQGHFKAIQIALVPSGDDGPLVAHCGHCHADLAERHKLCPCRAVGYCGRECQKAHWPVHKVMCAARPSMGQQFASGLIKQGSLLVSEQ